MPELPATSSLIQRFCVRDSLSTYDPYDVWKTALGYRVKNFYNHHRYLGIAPAAAVTIFDTFINNRARLFYSPQEYPIVRAWAAQILLNEYTVSGEHAHLEAAGRHLDWLKKSSCTGYSGPCWGLAFDYAVSKDFVYGVNTPLATMTPYVAEAMARFTEISGDDRFAETLAGVFDFLENDLVVLEESDQYRVTSYAPIPDRRVINAVSYTMYCYSLLRPYVSADDAQRALGRIQKLYAFVRDNQGDDGSWLYSPDGDSFIDCFHSCIVIKNLIKTSRDIDLPDCAKVIERGYAYLKSNFVVSGSGLVRRFAKANKPGIVRYDLYDNAEMLSLACLMRDDAMVDSLSAAIQRNFVRGDDIFSQIDCFGIRRNRNMLRWAILPYLYACSLQGRAA